MKALVTGGAGFIGSHLVDLLLERGYQVRVFDNLELPTHKAGLPAYLAPAAEFVLGDMRDRDAVAKALQGVDVVLHLAATGGFTPRIADYMAANSLGTAQMLETIRDNRLPVRKIVVASSISVYGEGKYRCAHHGDLFPRVRPVNQMERREWEVKCPHCGASLSPVLTDEETPVNPATAYGISKYDQERLVLMFGAQTGIPTVALRYFVTYGPRQSVHNPYTGICSIFSSRIMNDLPIVIYEDGNQTRDFVFVRDVARANVFVLEESRADFGVFNVGTGQATTVVGLADALRECLGREAQVEVPNRFRPGEVRHMVADAGKLARLGFRAECSVREGLRQYVEWLREQGPLPEYFANAERELEAAGVVRSAS
ncbi:MAG TPA: NAD-dependent epimerase/dehydratase family protein [Blastocatellia bacterium]|nr:NAD-dependent epimerase/dehydratase family protein [Blastocatellia bacterium]